MGSRPNRGESDAEAAVEAASRALFEALHEGATEPLLEELAARYAAEFEHWALACGFEPGRSSFEQRADRSVTARSDVSGRKSVQSPAL